MPLFYCKYKGFMPLFQDLYLHKLPFFPIQELQNKIERQKNFYRLQHTEKSIE